jgi:hypothetical protein
MQANNVGTPCWMMMLDQHFYQVNVGLMKVCHSVKHLAPVTGEQCCPTTRTLIHRVLLS